MMSSSSSKKLMLALLMSAAAVVTCSSRTPSGHPNPRVSNFGLTVVITNTLEGKQNLQVHCKDKNGDFGVQQVPFGTSYSFEVVPAPFVADYYCGFVFDDVLHWFDIYKWGRDYGLCPGGECYWFVIEDGPCYSYPDAARNCYPWNQD